MTAVMRSEAELTELLRTILQTNGCSAKVAAILAINCARAERDGSTSHGTFRIPDYVSTLRSGWADGAAEPKIEAVAPAFIRVDADNGFAAVALEDVRELAVCRAKTQGAVIVAIRNSHHLGALALDVEPFAEKGLIALSVTNSMAVVAAPGANRPIYGTNPIAFAAPQAGSEPLVIDLATSSMANGDLRVHAREGWPVPEMTGTDREGRPTTDAAAILDGGALLPFGGHKGAAIALMVELLCAALGGGQFSHEVDWSGHPGARSAKTGQTLIIIDPAAGATGLAPFLDRAARLAAVARQAGQPHLPGDRRLRSRQQAEAGIPFTEEAWSSMQALIR